MFCNLATIFQHIVFDLVLPTVDTYGDINFAIGAFSTGNFGIGVLMISPVVINFILCICKWMMTSFDGKKEKRFSWIFVILNVWPQYQVSKLIFAIVTKKPESYWKQLQHKIKMELSFIEPIVEGVPQFFISMGIFTILVSKNKSIEGPMVGTFENTTWLKNGSDITTVFGDTTLGISNQIMFPLSLLLSLFGGVKSTVDYLHNSPMKISSESKVCNGIILVSTILYVISSFWNKLTAFIVVSYQPIPGHGGWKILLVFIVFILAPGLITTAPLIRYLGLSNTRKLYLSNPQLLILPIITDYIFGPLDGYGSCSCCCCFCRCLCCGWCCCCKACRFDEGTKFRILKGISWAKVIYNLIY